MNSSLTTDQILSTFEAYNLEIWPMQAVAYFLGFAALFFAVKRTQGSSRTISAILSFLWVWTGLVFCMFYFGPVSTAGYAMGILMIIQGVVLFADAMQPKMTFRCEANLYSVIGILFIAYAMIGYPFVGHLLGHNYPRTLPFGLVPCPTTVFTFGLLMLADVKVPKRLIAIPILFAIAAVVPISLGIFEDVGLLVAGVLGTAMILYRDSKRKMIAAQTGSVTNS
jgi:hypothetical protein